VPGAGHELVGATVDLGDHGVDAEVDPVFGVPPLRVHEHGVAPGAALQVPLGERGPLVGPARLGAEQDDAPVESLGAQRLGGLRAGHPGPDDDERG
jgi:hypothetical protein